MSASNIQYHSDINSGYPRFGATPINRPNDNKPPMHARPKLDLLGSLPPVIPVSPLFVEAIKDIRCPLCDLVSEDWESPVGATEVTVSFNKYQTAMVNTACAAISRLYGDDPRFKDKRASSLIEIVRLFLLTPPAYMAMKFHERESRTERGEVDAGKGQDRADWISEVRSDIPSAAPVEPPPAPPLDPYDPMYGDLKDMDSGYKESE